MSIDKFLNRVSVRDFTNEIISDEDLSKLVDVINNSPTSTNSQQFSAIIVKDQAIKNFIAANNGNQKHIAESAAFVVFLADRTRVLEVTKRTKVMSSELMTKHDFVRVVVDATIAATYANDALIEMGYGTTFVGGILAFGDELKVKLNIPDTAFPIVGLSFGKATKRNPLRPKMNKVFVDQYSVSESIEYLDKYAQESVAYFTALKQPDYIEQTKNVFSMTGPYAPNFEKAGKFVEEEWKKFK